MFPQARLVSLQLDQEAGKRIQLSANEAPLTFGSFYVQELLGGDKSDRCDDNDDNYNYICNYGRDFEILSGWDSARAVLYFSSRTSAAPFIQHVYRLKSGTNHMSIKIIPSEMEVAPHPQNS